MHEGDECSKKGIIKSIFTELFKPVLKPCSKCEEKQLKTCPPLPNVVELHRKANQKSCKKRQGHRLCRPYFTFWKIIVDTLVLVAALCTYKFAPMGTTYKPVEKMLLRHNLAYETVVYMQQENFWIGPDYEDLIHFGAKYSPCMRRDKAVEDLMEADSEVEASTGCCLREDLNVCWQSASVNCTSAFSKFYNNSVCGLGRDFCGSLADRTNDSLWEGPITSWPNCAVTNRTMLKKSEYPTQACEVTARPCCFGLQGQCATLSEEECDFRNGYFHENKTLCSQVNCMENVCGIDISGTYQFYRFLLPSFIHCGIIHLITSLLFMVFIVRPLEMAIGWWRTALIYLISGCSGTLVSAFLTPYQPEVGSSGSLFGIIGVHIARDFVDMADWSRKVGEWRYDHSLRKMLAWLFICLLLLIPGLLPWIDNWGHIGGLVFGFMTGIVVLDHRVKRSEWDWTVRITTRVVMVVIMGLITFLLVYLFYYKQEIQIHAGFLNCIPFTKDFCQDSCMELRPRVRT